MAKRFNKDTVIGLIERHAHSVAHGDIADAESALAEAREIDPATLEIELARRAFENVIGNKEQIEARRREIVQRLGGVAVAAPEHIDAWLLLSRMLGEMGDMDGVMHATASGLKRDPQNLTLWIRRTLALIREKRWDSASRSLRQAVLIGPTDDRVERLCRVHPTCLKCHALLPSMMQERCTCCGADGPGMNAPVGSVRTREGSKFDLYFNRVREILAESLNMPQRITRMVTLDTLLKRHLKRTNIQCSHVLDAMKAEWGDAFDKELFHAAVYGFLDLLVADLIRAIDPTKDNAMDTGIRRRFEAKAS